MKYVLMLEDDLERISRFQAIIALHHPAAKFEVYRTAQAFIAAYYALCDAPSLIGLDHDLFVDSPDDPDPGDGRVVTDFLVTRLLKFPILIHSTNTPAAESMMFSLRDAGWTVDRISPIGEDWIEAFWYPIARDTAARGNDDDSN